MAENIYNPNGNYTENGSIEVIVTDEENNYPLDKAKIRLSYTGIPGIIVEEFETNTNGNTELIRLAAPPREFSMEPSEQQPYSEYTIQITAEGYENEEIAGIEILPDITSKQYIKLKRKVNNNKENFERIVIPPHTLFGDYPPKIEEAEIKPVNESGEIVLNKVVIPEYIIVHDGPVNDNMAKNYYVRYKDYIKNVASSEIYATWPESTIRANVLAIMSFTLNRVYTEWYRNKGYDYTITSSTAYDHKWIHGRNIFDTIDRVVDEIFDSYLSKPDIKQPILTQYCDGQKVDCSSRGWMSQWGSKYLGDKGYSEIEILRYYYGNDMYINIAEEISGIPASWPGYDLSNGSSGDKVLQLQEELNVISGAYPYIKKIRTDGIYGSETKKAVEEFQNIFGLPQTGIVDYPTWYKIQEIYVAVSRIAELQ